MTIDHTALGYQRSVDLLQSYGIPLARARLVSNPADLAEAAQEIGFPAAVKLVAPGYSHKTEAGLLRLNLPDLPAVRQATAELERRADEISGEGPVEGYLVQEMVSGGFELIAGISTDAQFGPVLLLGAGGVWVELLEDTALCLPPLTGRQAQAMIAELRASALLRGYRGMPPADLPALSRLLVLLGRLAIEQAGWLESLDLNPVIALPAGKGVKVVDQRIFSRSGEPVRPMEE